MITRRRFAKGVCAAVAGYGLIAIAPKARAAGGFKPTLADDIARIERESGGRLGVAVLDTGSGARVGHRADERFPICSTFKMLLAAATLARVDAGKERLDRRVRIKASDIVPNSPTTKERVDDVGMTVGELCEAAMIVSDNTAANLLLARLGGPSRITAYARSLGDTVTRLDRYEVALNEAKAGDPRDTTSPAAMLANLDRLVLGNALPPAAKEQLTQWLIANRTGDTRLRAGLPAGWRVGDRTGAGENGTTNDIAVIWPPGRAPILLTTYLTQCPAPTAQRNATLANVARAVAAAMEG